MKEKIKKDRVSRIVEIIKKNRNLPFYQIKRIVKKEFPEINSDELMNILLKHNKEINNKKEKGER